MAIGSSEGIDPEGEAVEWLYGKVCLEHDNDSDDRVRMLVESRESQKGKCHDGGL